MALISDKNCCCTVVELECFLLGYINLVGSISLAVIQIISLAFVALIVTMEVNDNPYNRKRLLAIVGFGSYLAFCFYLLTGDIAVLVGLHEKNLCVKSPCTSYLVRCPFGIPMLYSLMIYIDSGILLGIRKVYYEMQMQNPNGQLPAPAA